MMRIVRSSRSMCVRMAVAFQRKAATVTVIVHRIRRLFVSLIAVWRRISSIVRRPMIVPCRQIALMVCAVKRWDVDVTPITNVRLGHFQTAPIRCALKCLLDRVVCMTATVQQPPSAFKSNVSSVNITVKLINSVHRNHTATRAGVCQKLHAWQAMNARTNPV
ncbi:hypothetical protein Q1695_010986 [Nippostrongylus brasiliensis]|nr:hypothetical protein Q1695_010986 [Nippostrongylus brasiliensis]